MTATSPGRVEVSSGGVNRPLIAFWIVAVAVSLLVTWPLLAGDVPAFRDGLHFYFPLVGWLDAQPSLLPMWNPADGLGTNVIGEMSSGLFYPGRVLMWLPGLSIAQRLGILALAHIWLAALTTFYAARRSDCSYAAATLAAISFAFGCPVLFQHTNIIYLVSAAWWPVILAQCIAIIRDQQPNWWLWSMAASMMLLGGDPQGTLVAGIITSLCMACQLLRKQFNRRALLQSGMFFLSIAVVTAVTAVQWIPTWYWLQQSSRSLSEPKSHAASRMSVGSSNSLNSPSAELPKLLDDLGDLGDNEVISASNRYAFSIAPWHLLTMIWGTAGGHYSPDNTRWLSALRAEPRMWIPSLSIGLIPLLLSVTVLTQPRLAHGSQRTTVIALAAISLFSLLAMFGNYTPLWAARHVARWLDVNVAGWPGDEVGGVTWLLTQCVPLYSTLRYPAKWSVYFASAMCLLSARGLDSFTNASPERAITAEQGTIDSWMLTRLRQLTATIAALSILLLVIGVGMLWIAELRLPAQRWLQRAPLDAWHGRLHFNATALVIANSLFTTLAVALLLLFFCRRRVFQNNVSYLRMTILGLSLLELACMARYWIVTVDSQVVFKQQSGPRSAIASAPPWHPPRVWAAIGRADFDAWHVNQSARSTVSNTTDAAQLAMEAAQYQHSFLLGKLHLCTANIYNVTALGTLTPQRLADVRKRLAQADDMQSNNQELDEALAWLGVTHRLVNPTEPVWQPVPDPRPFVDIPLADRSSFNVQMQSNDHWTIEVNTDGPSHLDIRWFQDGGWHARLTNTDGRKLDVIPYNIDLGLFQRVPLPGGQWTVDLHYETPGLKLGGWITCITLSLLAVTFLSRCALAAVRTRQPI